jgi:hypothetical protein
MEEHSMYIEENELSNPDAGFAAAAQEAGIGYPDLVSGMLDFMFHRAIKK